MIVQASLLDHSAELIRQVALNEGGLIAEAVAGQTSPLQLTDDVAQPFAQLAEAAAKESTDGSSSKSIGTALLAALAAREAELLHYDLSQTQIFSTADQDLALLIGDRLYALGLEALSKIGDGRRIVILSLIVQGLAQAHSRGVFIDSPDLDRPSCQPSGAATHHLQQLIQQRTDDVWRAGCAALIDPDDLVAAKKLQKFV